VIRVQARLNKVTGVTASVDLSTERAYISAPVTVSALDLAGVIQGGGVQNTGSLRARSCVRGLCAGE